MLLLLFWRPRYKLDPLDSSSLSFAFILPHIRLDYTGGHYWCHKVIVHKRTVMTPCRATVSVPTARSIQDSDISGTIALCGFSNDFEKKKNMKGSRTTLIKTISNLHNRTVSCNGNKRSACDDNCCVTYTFIDTPVAISFSLSVCFAVKDFLSPTFFLTP